MKFFNKKIIYVLSTTSEYAGSSKAFLNLFNGILNKGIEPLIICPDENGIFQILRKRNINVKRLNYRFAAYPPFNNIKNLLLFIPRLCGRVFLNSKAARNLYQLALEYEPDLIHTNVSVIDIGFRAAKKIGIPHIWHIREYQNLDFNIYVYPFKKKYLKKIKEKSFSICITKGIQTHFELLGCNCSRVIYDGVLSCNDIILDEEKDLFFLFAGRLEKNKGIEDLFFSFSKFIDRYKNVDILLKIAGDTNDVDYYTYLRTLLKQLNLENRVVFLGMLKNIHLLMSKSLALIVPSVSEGFGFVTAEAMFNGCLVIGRNTAGTKEQFDNGVELSGVETGIRYDTQDELLEAMNEVVLNGIKKYIPNIKNAQNVVTQLYSIENNLNIVCDYYQEILNHFK